MIGATARWIDDRLGMAHFGRTALDKAFPDHWSFLLGEIALYAFAVLVATGTYLTFFFEPSSREVIYQGSYVPLQGVPMSAAFRSTVELSFDVRAGLVMRQVHHWAALLFLAAIVVHLCRIFFTGAFRRPRELNWLVGVTLLVLGLLNGFTGYSLPDDLLSGTGLRIAYSILLSVPVVGSYAAFFVFGGEFPSPDVLSRLHIVHVLIVPAAIAALISAHLAVVVRQKHTQFPGRGRTEDNVVGSRLWPTYAVRSVGWMALVVAVLAALGGLVQINPVWLYGPYEASAVSTGAQPDWYLGWVEGALRILPRIPVRILGYRMPEAFVPGVLLPGVTFAALYAWPFLEARVTGDRAEHHLLDRPRDRPVRTAIGLGALSFYVVLLLAGGQDIMADVFSLSIPTVTVTLRVAVLVVPPAIALLTWKVCRDLAAAVPLEVAAQAGEPPIGPNDPDETSLGSAEPARVRARSARSEEATGAPWPVRLRAAAAGAAGALGLAAVAAALLAGRAARRRGGAR